MAYRAGYLPLTPNTPGHSHHGSVASIRPQTPGTLSIHEYRRQQSNASPAAVVGQKTVKRRVATLSLNDGSQNIPTAPPTPMYHDYESDTEDEDQLGGINEEGHDPGGFITYSLSSILGERSSLGAMLTREERTPLRPMSSYSPVATQSTSRPLLIPSLTPQTTMAEYSSLPGHNTPPSLFYSSLPSPPWSPDAPLFQNLPSSSPNFLSSTPLQQQQRTLTLDSPYALGAQVEFPPKQLQFKSSKRLPKPSVRPHQPPVRKSVSSISFSSSNANQQHHLQPSVSHLPIADAREESSDEEELNECIKHFLNRSVQAHHLSARRTTSFPDYPLSALQQEHSSLSINSFKSYSISDEYSFKNSSHSRSLGRLSKLPVRAHRSPARRNTTFSTSPLFARQQDHPLTSSSLSTVSDGDENSNEASILLSPTRFSSKLPVQAHQSLSRTKTAVPALPLFAKQQDHPLSSSSPSTVSDSNEHLNETSSLLNPTEHSSSLSARLHQPPESTNSFPSYYFITEEQQSQHSQSTSSLLTTKIRADFPNKDFSHFKSIKHLPRQTVRPHQPPVKKPISFPSYYFSNDIQESQWPLTSDSPFATRARDELPDQKLKGFQSIKRLPKPSARLHRPPARKSLSITSLSSVSASPRLEEDMAGTNPFGEVPERRPSDPPARDSYYDDGFDSHSIEENQSTPHGRRVGLTDYSDLHLDSSPHQSSSYVPAVTRVIGQYGTISPLRLRPRGNNPFAGRPPNSPAPSPSLPPAERRWIRPSPGEGSSVERSTDYGATHDLLQPTTTTTCPPEQPRPVSPIVEYTPSVYDTLCPSSTPAPPPRAAGVRSVYQHGPTLALLEERSRHSASGDSMAHYGEGSVRPLFYGRNRQARHGGPERGNNSSSSRRESVRQTFFPVRDTIARLSRSGSWMAHFQRLREEAHTPESDVSDAVGDGATVDHSQGLPFEAPALSSPSGHAGLAVSGGALLRPSPALARGHRRRHLALGGTSNETDAVRSALEHGSAAPGASGEVESVPQQGGSRRNTLRTFPFGGSDRASKRSSRVFSGHGVEDLWLAAPEQSRLERRIGERARQATPVPEEYEMQELTRRASSVQTSTPLLSHSQQQAETALSRARANTAVAASSRAAMRNNTKTPAPREVRARPVDLEMGPDAAASQAATAPAVSQDTPTLALTTRPASETESEADLDRRVWIFLLLFFAAVCVTIAVSIIVLVKRS